jgi:uncharacterized repeat protein (TIGR01451 family)
MKRALTIIVVLINCYFVESQTFLKKGNGLQIKNFYHQQNINYYLSCSDSAGQIYTILYDTVSAGFNFGKEYSRVRLRIFNGISWLSTNPINIYSTHTIDAPRILDIQVVKDRVYISGSFDSSENNLGSGILSYYNNSWHRVAQTILQRNPDYFEVSKIHPFGNDLLIAGNFDSISGERVNGLLLLDNNNWTSIGIGYQKGFQNLSGTSNVFFYGGTDSLYVFNKNKIKPDSIEIGGSNIKKLGVYRNSQFQQIAYPYNYIGALAEFKKNLVVLPTSNLIYIRSIVYRENGNWTSVNLPGNDSFYVTNYMGHLEHGNLLYLFFQSPTSGISLYSFDGDVIKYKNQFKLSDNYLNLEFSKNKKEVFLSGNFSTLSDGNFNDSFNKIVGISFEPRTMISGICFHDLNNDGTYQNGEPLLKDVKVYEKNLPLQTLSNKAGVYTIYAETGKNYQISAQSESGLIYTGNASIINSRDSIYKMDLALVSDKLYDAGVYLYSGTAHRAKQGFETPYTIELNNGTEQAQTILVTVLHDKRLTGLSFKNFSVVVKGSNQFSVLKTVEAKSKVLLYFNAVFLVDSFTLGEKVLTKVVSNMLDDNSSNNVDTIIQTVVSAYDPNIKVALPSEVVSNQTTIKYVIYFENLGNDTALNVTVIDTFGSLLSLKDVVYGGTSHGNVAPSIENNCLVWHFENIKLPPRSTDSINNKGFVSFRSNLNKQAKKGDTIYNKAAIFFDYQKPVITNKAKVIFIKNSSINNRIMTKGIEFYPNPSAGKILYTNFLESNTELEFYNVLGQMVHTERIGKEGQLDLTEKLAAGIYIIKIKGKIESEGNLIIEY